MRKDGKLVVDHLFRTRTCPARVVRSSTASACSTAGWPWSPRRLRLELPVCVVVADDVLTNPRGHRPSSPAYSRHRRLSLQAENADQLLESGCDKSCPMSPSSTSACRHRTPMKASSPRNRSGADHPDVGVLVLSQYVEPSYALRLLDDVSRARRLPAQGTSLRGLGARRRDPAGRRRRLRGRPHDHLDAARAAAACTIPLARI